MGKSVGGAVPALVARLLAMGVGLDRSGPFYFLFSKDKEGLAKALAGMAPGQIDALCWPEAGEKSHPFRAAAPSYNLLQWAVHFRDLEAARALMDAGANANFFNAGVTAVGMAGYLHLLNFLKLFEKRGADLRLELRSEHLAPGDPAVGSTLLHRIAERAPARGMESKLAVCGYLAGVYMSDGGEPWPRTAGGADAAQAACDEETKELLLARYAAMEKGELCGSGMRRRGKRSAKKAL